VKLELASLSFSAVGDNIDIPADAWLRAKPVIAGIEHYVDLVWVRRDPCGVQRTACPELDAMLELHHLACGADGPFAPVDVGGKPYILFVTPSSD
jgi:hypothetical protein